MEGDLDASGWELKKSLLLLRKSNAALIERFNSPIAYMENKRFAEGFRSMIEMYYSPTAVFYHHYAQALKFREETVSVINIKLKSYFYLVRSLLSCNWIVRSTERVPMEIEKLMLLSDEKMNTILRELIKLKSGAGEKYQHPLSREMMNIVNGLFNFIDSKKDSLAVNKTDHAALDAFFKTTLYESVDN